MRTSDTVGGYRVATHSKFHRELHPPHLARTPAVMTPVLRIRTAQMTAKGTMSQ
jgi:hypothetical protein